MSGIRAHHVEGLKNSQWVLMDFLIFWFMYSRKNTDLSIVLEELWADGKVTKVMEA